MHVKTRLWDHICEVQGFRALNGQWYTTNYTSLIQTIHSCWVHPFISRSTTSQGRFHESFFVCRLSGRWADGWHGRLHIRVLHGRKYPWTEKLEKSAGMTGRMQTRVYDAEVLAVLEIFWSSADVLFGAWVDISRRVVRPDLMSFKPSPNLVAKNPWHSQLADQSIDPDLGLYKPIGSHKRGVHPRSKNKDVANWTETSISVRWSLLCSWIAVSPRQCIQRCPLQLKEA
jgi:hypothetical protein